MAHDIFISYSSKDKPVADAACATLEARGIRCWIAPRDITPGADWGETIIDAIQGSKAFVLIFSQNANASVQIKREVERAINKGIPVIPLRIENVLPAKSLEYFLSTPHWLDAYSPPLEKHLNYLVEVIRSVLDKKPAPQPVPDDTLPTIAGMDRRIVLGGAAGILLLGAASWFFWGPSSHNFVGKWAAAKIDVYPSAPSPFGAFSISIFLKAAEAGRKLFATSIVDDVGSYNYLWGGDDTGTVKQSGPGRMTFTSDLTHQATEFSYFLVSPASAGSAVVSLGGKNGESAIAIQNMGGMQSMLVGTSGGPGLTGHWYTDTPALGPIDAIKTALDVTADGRYHYHFEFSEAGVWQAADGKWTRTRQGAPPVQGTYVFSGGNQVKTTDSNGVTVWQRAE